jgi:hypothetical protein
MTLSQQSKARNASVGLGTALLSERSFTSSSLSSEEFGSPRLCPLSRSRWGRERKGKGIHSIYLQHHPSLPPHTLSTRKERMCQAKGKADHSDSRLAWAVTSVVVQALFSLYPALDKAICPYKSPHNPSSWPDNSTTPYPADRGVIQPTGGVIQPAEGLSSRLEGYPAGRMGYPQLLSFSSCLLMNIIPRPLCIQSFNNYLGHQHGKDFNIFFQNHLSNEIFSQDFLCSHAG